MNSPNQNYSNNSTLAIASLITGILGFTLLPTVGSIIAIITGHMAKNEIKKSGGLLTGNGLANAGLVLGYLNIVIVVCIIGFVTISPIVLWFYGDSLIQR
jgi:hypothetical protein